MDALVVFLEDVVESHLESLSSLQQPMLLLLLSLPIPTTATSSGNRFLYDFRRSMYGDVGVLLLQLSSSPSSSSSFFSLFRSLSSSTESHRRRLGNRGELSVIVIGVTLVLVLPFRDCRRTTFCSVVIVQS